MIRNYLKTAFRSLKKNISFTVINILGLALGLSICLLIVFYVIDELSYDRYNTKFDRIFRVNSDMTFSGTTTNLAIAAPPVAAALVRGLPEIDKSVRITPSTDCRFKKGDENVQENRVAYSDPTLFDIFTLPMIEGDPKTALKEPNSVVINESTAKKYFSNTAVVGQTLLLVNENKSYKITGVIRDMPRQSHFNFDFILSLSSLPSANDNNWLSMGFNTYVLLKPGTDYKKVQTKIPAFFKQQLKNIGFDYDEFAKGGNNYGIHLMPLIDIHLKSNRFREIEANSSMEYVYIFSAIAILILLMACINFMNLSTAHSANRAREVGVRKVLGSALKHLIAQFLSESIMITFTATIIAALAAWALLPLFNNISGKDMSITLKTIIWFFPTLIVIIIVVGILAGWYPAFFLSAFQPIKVLRGKLAAGFKGSILRSILVVLQFSISIFLIVGTLVIYNQLRYIQNKDLGFNRSHVLIIKNTSALENPRILKQEIKQMTGVSNATLSNFLPTGTLRWPRTVSPSLGNSIQAEFWTIDEDYIPVMGMQVTRGRNFSSQLLTDSSSMLVNETAAKMMGLNKDPINQIVRLDSQQYSIVGVIKDFIFNSLRYNITPVVLVLGSDWRASLSIRLQSDNIKGLLSQIENKWDALSPHQRFEFSFMDKDFDALYQSEQRMGEVFAIFSVLAILIACLGLFGLTVFSAEQRIREIGIRKVLGANVPSLVMMLSKDFLKWIAISLVIALPAGWLIMQKWLQDFAYRQGIQWWVFVIASGGTVLIAFITISMQSIKAATISPVKSLKNE
jgi:putative ABC transport system permease protein